MWIKFGYHFTRDPYNSPLAEDGWISGFLYVLGFNVCLALNGKLWLMGQIQPSLVSLIFGVLCVCFFNGSQKKNGFTFLNGWRRNKFQKEHGTEAVWSHKAWTVSYLALYTKFADWKFVWIRMYSFFARFFLLISKLLCILHVSIDMLWKSESNYYSYVFAYFNINMYFWFILALCFYNYSMFSWVCLLETAYI